MMLTQKNVFSLKSDVDRYEEFRDAIHYYSGISCNQWDESRMTVSNLHVCLHTLAYKICWPSLVNGRCIYFKSIVICLTIYNPINQIIKFNNLSLSVLMICATLYTCEVDLIGHIHFPISAPSHHPFTLGICLGFIPFAGCSVA